MQGCGEVHRSYLCSKVEQLYFSVQPSPQPVVHQSPRVGYRNKEDLVIGTSERIATVAKNPKSFMTKDKIILKGDMGFICEQKTLDLQPKKHYVDHSLAEKAPMSGIMKDRMSDQEEIICSEPEHLKVIPQVKNDLKSEGHSKETDTNIPIAKVVHDMPHRGITKEKFDTKCQLMVDVSLKLPAFHISLEQAFYQSFELIVGFTTLLLRCILGKFVSISNFIKTFLRIQITSDSRNASGYFWSNTPLIHQRNPKIYKFKYRDKTQYPIRLNNHKVRKYCSDIGDRKRLKYDSSEGFETSKPPDKLQIALKLLHSMMELIKEIERQH